MPLIGQPWIAARAITRLLGAPIPDHVAELLGRGRLADGSLAASALGVAPAWTTPQVIDALYAWTAVSHFHPHEHPIRRSVA